MGVIARLLHSTARGSFSPREVNSVSRQAWISLHTTFLKNSDLEIFHILPSTAFICRCIERYSKEKYHIDELKQ
jgi:hypothetical protein